MTSVEPVVTFSRGDKTLAVTYSVVNPAPGPIYLFNVLWTFGEGGGRVLDSIPLYASLDAGGRLVLGKVVYPRPRLELVEVANVPLARKVEPGEAWTETVNLTLPVQEHSPYYRATPSGEWQDVEVNAASFWISWIAETAGLVVRPGWASGALDVWHPELWKLIGTAKTLWHPLSVPARRRVGGFERL